MAMPVVLSVQLFALCQDIVHGCLAIMDSHKQLMVKIRFHVNTLEVSGMAPGSKSFHHMPPFFLFKTTESPACLKERPQDVRYRETD